MLRFLRLIVPLLASVQWSVEAAAQIATVPPSPYQVDVEVEGRDDATRRSAMTEALRTVVVRLSGDQSAAQHPEVLAADAERAMERFEYREVLQRDELSGQPRVRLYLRVTFSAPSVNALLVRAGLRGRGEGRPPLVVGWRGPGGPRTPGELTVLTEVLRGRGIELRPTALADEPPTGFGDDETLDWLRRTARALGGEQMLWVESGGGPEAITARVWLVDAQDHQRLALRAADAADLQRQIGQRAADWIQSRYAALALGSSPVTVEASVLELADAAEFATTLAALQDMSLVAAIELTGASGQELRLRLTLLGGTERFAAGLAAGAPLRLIGRDGERLLLAPAR